MSSDPSPWTLEPDYGFEPWLCFLPAVQPWASHLTSLWLRFNCEMETRTVSPSRHRGLNRNNALRRTSMSYYQVEKVGGEFAIGCLKETVWGGGSTQSMPIRKGEGGHSGRRDHRRLVLGAILRRGQSPGRRLERGPEPRRGLGWKVAGTYLQSLAAPPRPALPPLRVPNIFPELPQDPGSLSSSPLSPSPRNLATPQINSVRELGGRGVWPHWLHRIHRGE